MSRGRDRQNVHADHQQRRTLRSAAASTGLQDTSASSASSATNTTSATSATGTTSATSTASAASATGAARDASAAGATATNTPSSAAAAGMASGASATRAARNASPRLVESSNGDVGPAGVEARVVCSSPIPDCKAGRPTSWIGKRVVGVFVGEQLPGVVIRSGHGKVSGWSRSGSNSCLGTDFRWQVLSRSSLKVHLRSWRTGSGHRGVPTHPLSCRWCTRAAAGSSS